MDLGTSSDLQDDSLIPAFRTAWVAKQMEARQDEFVEASYSRIFVGTWNVNGRQLSDSLRQWLVSEFEPDLYVICLQEMDSSAEALLIRDELREEQWTAAVYATFAEVGKDYRKFASKQLVGILMLIYAKADTLGHISHINTVSAGCGILGMMGNKGGVAIKFRYRDSEICFVNSHLAAFENQVQRRNDNYHELCRRLIFAGERSDDMERIIYGDTYSRGVYEPSPDAALRIENNSIFCNDHVIWCGDLNYRIDLPETQVKKFLELQEYSYLMEFDQLHLQKKEGKVFRDFEEGNINFPCTYKYDLGTDNFDTSDKKRNPAWTDRILWFTKHPDGVKQLRYAAHMQLCNTSDHRPVSAIFDIRLKNIDKDKQREILNSLHRHLDQLENDSMPSVSVSTLAFNLGRVKYLDTYTCDLELYNDGQTIAKYQFATKPSDTRLCKSWLNVDPIEGLILPGEKEKVLISVFIGNDEAAMLNSKKDELDDILLLRLYKGKDFFISVYGQYEPTCFAMPLERLCETGLPVRPLQNGQTPRTVMSGQLSLPHEFARMLDYLVENGMEVAELFLTPGESDIMAAFREALDTGSPWPELNHRNDKELAHSMAQNVLQFVVALPNSIVPDELYEQSLLSANESAEAAFAILELLPRVHANLLLYLTAFLRSYLLVQNSTESNIGTSAPLRTQKLAVWAKALFRPPRSHVNSKLADKGPKLARDLVLTFIDGEDRTIGNPPEVDIDFIDKLRYKRSRQKLNQIPTASHRMKSDLVRLITGTWAYGTQVPKLLKDGLQTLKILPVKAFVLESPMIGAFCCYNVVAMAKWRRVHMARTSWIPSAFVDTKSRLRIVQVFAIAGTLSWLEKMRSTCCNGIL